MAVLTVWGAPQSGKTEIAIALAKTLARSGKVVCLISTQNFAEMYGKLDIDDLEGKGILKAVSSTSNNSVSQNAIAVNKEKGLFMLAPTPFDSALDLVFTKEQAQRILANANGLFDYTVVDCTARINNAITGEALALSEKVIIPIAGSATNKVWHDANECIISKILNKAIYVRNVTAKRFDYITLEHLLGCEPVCGIPYCHNLKDLAASRMGLMEAGRSYCDALNRIAEGVTR